MNFDRVKQEDWMAMLRITSEAASLPMTDDVRRRHVMDSLRQYLGAKMCTSFDAAVPHLHLEKPVATEDSLITIGATPEQHQGFRSVLIEKIPEEISARLTEVIFTKRTIRREEFATNDEWNKSEYLNRLLKPMHVHDQLSTKIDMPDGSWVGMALMREKSDRPFDERDKQIIAMFHKHSAHLYARPRSPLQIQLQKLPPRLRPILQGLLAGDGDKQIAYKLGFSTHTVNTYVKQLYRLLEVSGRGELFAKFGGGSLVSP